MRLNIIQKIAFLVLCLWLSPEGYSVEFNSDKPFTVIIDPGHGGKDIGASGNSVKEKDINLSVALLLSKYIKEGQPDVKVIFTRNTDKFIPLIERAEIANKSKGDLFISIHANSVKKNKTPYGTETYTLGLSRSKENLEVAQRENAVILLEDDYTQTYEGFDPNSSESYIMFEFMQNKYMDQSVSFASLVQKEFKNTAKRSDRGVKQAEFLVLRETSMPSILIELGFISNIKEAKYLNSSQGQREMAKCIYNSFKQYKKEHDRKNGIVTIDLPRNQTQDTTNEQLANIKSQPEEVKKNNTQTSNRRSASNKTSQSATKKKPDYVYRVQIMASDKKISTSSPEFKGYKNIKYIKENGIYKYTCGESSDWDEISKLRTSLVKKFKGAFIIKVKANQ